jgi:hypothetical protein
LVKLSSSWCRTRAVYVLVVIRNRRVRTAYGVEGGVGKGGEAGSVGNGV